jgi:alkaline phosphatase D
VHENWVGHVRTDDGDAKSPHVGVEFCGTSISSRSGGNARVAELLAENPHFVFADAERKGYGLVELTPRQMRVALRVVDDVRDRASGIGTLASFVVPAGTPRIERA